MRKSTIFISAVLTTFALVLLYGVVSAYRSISMVSVAAAEPISETATAEPTSVPTSTPSMITPEAAAQLASQVVGNTNLLSAESVVFNGVNAYLITFTNNDVVYVGLDGQILGIEIAPVVVNIAPPVKVKNNGGGGGGQTSQEDHDDDDEHDND